MAPRDGAQPPPQQQQQQPQPRLAPGRFFTSPSNRSLHSHSSSFEADDERSTTSPSPSSISPEPASSSMEEGASNVGSSAGGSHGRGGHGARGGHADDEPTYPGEDTRPTSTKELAGWYVYAFASETYVICGMCRDRLGTKQKTCRLA